LKRILDILAYSISGLALAGGVVYGWRQLTKPPELPPVPPLASIQPAPPPAAEIPPAAPAPAINPPPAPPPLPEQPDAAAQAAAQDQARFLALQQDCYRAAENNRNGEYPTFQAMACDRYTQFAAGHGWDPGTLPPYGQAAPPPPEPVAQEQPSIQDQSQLILLAPGYYGYDRGNGQRQRWPRQPETPGQPQQQIGPNYPLPPPQQPPPVSQRQRTSGKMVPAGPQN
jgi:hypothetical protein